METSLGAYVHIPFCIQRCHYCDFATYAKDQISPNQDYVDTLCLEIQSRRSLFSHKKLSTIYFGGGTPSLLEAHQIAKIIEEYKKQSFEFLDDIEITLEVNPATLTIDKVRAYKEAGVNRISIGCQSFDDDFLQACNREHKSQDTLATIALVQEHFQNYSLDLLFSLPKQSLEQLKKDLFKIKQIRPPHVSGYCLTLPEKHPMNNGRCSEEEQTAMFELVKKELADIDLFQYEISNFARPGYQSRHNNLYWKDKSYWGVGLSAHSYLREPDWGYRFWNLSTYKAYMDQMLSLKQNLPLQKSFPKQQIEPLNLAESVTDYCHTHLRLAEGLPTEGLRQKYGKTIVTKATERLSKLQQKGWVHKKDEAWSLTEHGLLLSNQVFAELLFSPSDIDKGP